MQTPKDTKVYCFVLRKLRVFVSLCYNDFKFSITDVVGT